MEKNNKCLDLTKHFLELDLPVGKKDLRARGENEKVENWSERTQRISRARTRAAL